MTNDKKKIQNANYTGIGIQRQQREDRHNTNNINVLVKSFGRIVAFRKAVLLSGQFIYSLSWALPLDFFGRRTAWMLGRTPP